jgi:hypothetical protein
MAAASVGARAAASVGARAAASVGTRAAASAGTRAAASAAFQIFYTKPTSRCQANLSSHQALINLSVVG